jgi:hypothetical protein
MKYNYNNNNMVCGLFEAMLSSQQLLSDKQVDVENGGSMFLRNVRV